MVIIYPFLGSTAKPKRGWARCALSELNPQEFTASFKPLFDKLEAAGVRLAAFELGNEINATGSNDDLSDPGSGRELKLAALNNANDPEERAAAAGYRGLRFGALVSAFEAALRALFPEASRRRPDTRMDRMAQRSRLPR